MRDDNDSALWIPKRFKYLKNQKGRNSRESDCWLDSIHVNLEAPEI